MEAITDSMMYQTPRMQQPVYYFLWAANILPESINQPFKKLSENSFIAY